LRVQFGENRSRTAILDANPTTRGSRPGKVVGTGINRYAPASASTLPVTDAGTF
jgi:hypothetical protein